MPLSKPKQRTEFHHRNIDCHGYHREDGLWDIEAHLIDTKNYIINLDTQGTLQAKEAPLHEMWLRLTLDDELIIHEVEAVTDASPFHRCVDITENFQKLKGLQIVAGFNQKVKMLFKGVEGCTHLTELLAPLASTAFQTIYSGNRKLREWRGEPKTEDETGKRPELLDSCYALASDGEVVKRHWSTFYTGQHQTKDKDIV